ncbi:uncharacterized protein LOC119309869 [Triticum dicoccoides]|uniref:uncharacterized protein LOC119309869 n=1 Tax=Triticum dicoccoides TaxID=85692 RepID=UPI001891D01F|nr:uncharacterized protein LOC119309869 [Triticum dicoccoides]
MAVAPDRGRGRWRFSPSPVALSREGRVWDAVEHKRKGRRKGNKAEKVSSIYWIPAGPARRRHRGGDKDAAPLRRLGPLPHLPPRSPLRPPLSLSPDPFLPCAHPTRPLLPPRRDHGRRPPRAKRRRRGASSASPAYTTASSASWEALLPRILVVFHLRHRRRHRLIVSAASVVPFVRACARSSTCLPCFPYADPLELEAPTSTESSVFLDYGRCGHHRRSAPPAPPGLAELVHGFPGMVESRSQMPPVTTATTTRRLLPHEDRDDQE